MAQANSEIKYLTPIAVDVKKKNIAGSQKLGIKYIDYKDAAFLLKFVNEQGKFSRAGLQVLLPNTRKRYLRQSKEQGI